MVKNNPLELLERQVLEVLDTGIIFFQGGDDGRGYRNMCKISGGVGLGSKSLTCVCHSACCVTPITCIITLMHV